MVSKLKFRLKKRPAYDSLVVAYMNDIVSSARAVQKILPLGPSGIEIMDRSLLQLALSKDPGLRDKFPEGIDNILLIEFDSFDPDTCTKTAQKVKALLQGQAEVTKITLAVSVEEKSRLWAIRKAAVPILYKLKGRKKILALIEDAAVPIENLVKYFAGVYSLLNNYKVNFVVYGHIAKGLLHTRPLLDLKDPQDVDLLKPLADDFYDLVSDLDGTVSGEHGDGRLRSAYIRRRFPDIYDLFLNIKHLLDPDNLMNPEIITHHDPGQMKKSLRFGENYHSKEPSRSLISWPDTFSNEIEKCHGCSQCTTVTSATRMCPVYKITREEAASPKAKANILRSIISGRIQNKEIYEYSFQHVIEHCFYCDSCAFECPSNVNIPKMALEARARYVRRYGTSTHNHMVSRVEMAGRTTRKFSQILKPMMALTPVKKLGERFAGLSANRDFIAFSPRSLSEQIPVQTGQGTQKVLYFAGCYASYIQPAIGLAAVNILNRLNFTVLTPEQHCCGLPMLSKGMVSSARSKIEDNLKKWGSLLDEVDAIVVTCSSCGLSLMQEWEYLLDNKMVERIKNKTIHISRMITEKQQSLKFKPADLNVVYHYPCHLKVQPDPDSSVSMLNAIKGVRVEALQTNCCGIAGSWGLAAKNFRLSKQIGQDLLDKLAASGATVGVTDCPTCRIQMEQFSEKLIRHPVEIVAQLVEK